MTVERVTTVEPCATQTKPKTRGYFGFNNRTDNGCRYKATHKINGRYFCARHAGEQALEFLCATS